METNSKKNKMIRNEIEGPGTLVQVVEPGLATKDDSLLKLPEPNIAAVRGFIKGSRIALWSLSYEDKPQASVFVYPSDYLIDNERIPRLDRKFSMVEKMLEFRQFNEIPAEDLNADFVRKLKPLISIMDHEYLDRGVSIKEHSYKLGWTDFVQEAIQSLKRE